MIKNWLKDIKEGRPLWLAECREEMKEDTEAVRTDVSVITAEGEPRSFSVMLPKVEAGEEFELMSRYLDANRINAAALLGQLDDTDCALSSAASKDTKAGQSSYVMPDEPLVCGVEVGGSDIKLILAEGDRIRRILAYDWNPSIATEAAMIMNPIYEFIEMAANGSKLDAIGMAFPCLVTDNKIYADEAAISSGIRESKGKVAGDELAKLRQLDDFLRPLCKEGAPVRILSDGYMAAYTLHNELRHSEAGRELIKDGIIALSLDSDIAFGWVRSDGRIPSLPGRLERCIFRIDSEEDAGFMDQDKILNAASMPLTNPKPCIDLLMNMAEGGEQNAEIIFKDLGLYLGHAIREIDFFVNPGTKHYIVLGRMAKNEYIFDLMSIGMQSIAPDAVVLQIDKGAANTPLMKAVADMGDVAIAEFARTAGCVHYARYTE